MKLLGSDFVLKHKDKPHTQNGEAMQCKHYLYQGIVWEYWPDTHEFITQSGEFWNRWIILSGVTTEHIYLVSLNTHVTPTLWCISPCNLFRSFWSIFIYNKLLCMNLWSLQNPCACFGRGRKCEVHVDFNYHYPTTWCLLPFPMKYNNDH